MFFPKSALNFLLIHTFIRSMLRFFVEFFVNFKYQFSPANQATAVQRLISGGQAQSSSYPLWHFAALLRDDQF